MSLNRERRQMEILAALESGELEHTGPDPWDELTRWWHESANEVLFPDQQREYDTEFRTTYLNATFGEIDCKDRFVGWERVASAQLPDECGCECDGEGPCDLCDKGNIYNPGNVAVLWRKVSDLVTFQMGEAHGMRSFTLALAPVWAPGCRSSPISNYGKLVKPGDFIVYGDGRGAFGRVLGRIIDCPRQTSEPEGERYEGELLVLELAPDGRWAYKHFVHPAAIKEAGPVPAHFLRWFLQPELPNPDVVSRLSQYGTLSNENIADPKCGPAALFGQCRRWIPGEHLPPEEPRE